MTEEIQTNPIDDLQPDASPEDAREIAAALVRSGTMSIADANKVLAGKGAVALSENSREEAKARKTRLMQDREFMKLATDGDPNAIGMLAELNARIAKADTKSLTDRVTPPASEYKFDTASRPEFRGASNQEIMGTDAVFAEWGQKLQLQPALARELVSMARDADALPVEQREARAIEQERMFVKALGSDGEQRAIEAEKTLREVSGLKIDLANVVRTAGATVAISLIHHAETLAATRKR